MIDTSVRNSSSPVGEDALGAELARGDAQIGTILPILRHLLTAEEHSVFSDEIMARLRGSLVDVALQLLDEQAAHMGGADRSNHPSQRVEAIVASLAEDSGFLSHCHALALEWQLTERLQSRLSLDPVLSPLMQALIASNDAPTAATAMALLAAQARFAQTQRRMRLSLDELPGDLLHVALVILRRHAGADGHSQDAAARGEAALRARYDEGRSRLGLIARLVAAMGGGATAALSVSHAGVAIFLSALAMASGQDRDLAILATTEGQQARLALTLRAAGLRPHAIEEQFLCLHPDAAPDAGIGGVGVDHAAALLARSSICPSI